MRPATEHGIYASSIRESGQKNTSVNTTELSVTPPKTTGAKTATSSLGFLRGSLHLAGCAGGCSDVPKLLGLLEASAS